MFKNVQIDVTDVVETSMNKLAQQMAIESTARVYNIPTSLVASYMEAYGDQWVEILRENIATGVVL